MTYDEIILKLAQNSLDKLSQYKNPYKRGTKKVIEKKLQKVIANEPKANILISEFAKEKVCLQKKGLFKHLPSRYLNTMQQFVVGACALNLQDTIGISSTLFHQSQTQDQLIEATIQTIPFNSGFESVFCRHFLGRYLAIEGANPGLLNTIAQTFHKASQNHQKNMQVTTQFEAIVSESFVTKVAIDACCEAGLFNQAFATAFQTSFTQDFEQAIRLRRIR